MRFTRAAPALVTSSEVPRSPLHHHILDHEDTGMTGQFKVIHT
ncbi:MAG: hypothetical protein AB8G26_12360 [Ilumatobacter sp.]